MKSYFNFLSRNKLYTFIEAVGMAVAIAFVLYIGTFLIGQFTSDYFIKKQGNIYVGQSERMYLSSGTVKEQIEGKFPEVKNICRIHTIHNTSGYSSEMQGGVSNNIERQNALVVDENFFEMFPFPLAEGNHSTALEAKNSVLLSESCAARLFPEHNSVGKELKIIVDGNEAMLTITGVFEDFRNSVFHAPDIIYRMDMLTSMSPNLIRNGSGSCAVFYQLTENADIETLAAGMNEILKENDYLYTYGLFKEYHLLPFKDISTNELEITEPFKGIVPADFISVFIAAGILLLLFAVLNYISLTVAQTGFRAKEMASRRLLGAQRSGIVLRYISESFMLTAASFIIGLLLASTFAPQFSELIGKEVDPMQHIGIVEITFMIIVVLLLSICSGIIPALMVSKYKPIDVVRGNFARNNKMVIGKILIATQSVVAIACIAVAMVMLLQLHYMVTKPVGYERDGRIMIANANRPSDYYIDELQGIAGVEKIGWLKNPPMSYSINGMSFDRNGAELNIDAFTGDQAAFEILGFKVIKQNAEPTNNSMWLPESVMMALNLDYDCTRLDLDDSYIPVCGIIEDFNKGSVNMEVSRSDFLTIPWIMEMFSESDFVQLRTLVVKVSGDENDVAQRIREFYKNRGFSEDEIVVQTYNEINSEMYAVENQNVALISIFTILVMLLASLAMLAMSAYYSKQHAKSTAVRRIMGCSRWQLYLQTVMGFLKAIGIAVMIACPIAYLAVGKWLENYSYRIDNHLWIYLLASLIMAAVALISVTWQTLRLINTNPTEALKKG